MVVWHAWLNSWPFYFELYSFNYDLAIHTSPWSVKEHKMILCSGMINDSQRDKYCPYMSWMKPDVFNWRIIYLYQMIYVRFAAHLWIAAHPSISSNKCCMWLYRAIQFLGELYYPLIQDMILAVGCFLICWYCGVCLHTPIERHTNRRVLSFNLGHFCVLA